MEENTEPSINARESPPKLVAETRNIWHAKMDPSLFSREIRAIHDKDTIRVYQAYSAAIAESAVAANSFHWPLQQGLWSKSRMTWIKPSKVWMAYRCAWTVLKDKNQARVLALDLSRTHFEQMCEKPL